MWYSVVMFNFTKGESNTLACLEDGLWSFPEAYCKIECLGPPAVPNAKLLVPQCDGRRHDVGTVCRYKCNPGYYITGTLTKKPRKWVLLCSIFHIHMFVQVLPFPDLQGFFTGFWSCWIGKWYKLNDILPNLCGPFSLNMIKTLISISPVTSFLYKLANHIPIGLHSAAYHHLTRSGEASIYTCHDFMTN